MTAICRAPSACPPRRRHAVAGAVLAVASLLSACSTGRKHVHDANASRDESTTRTVIQNKGSDTLVNVAQAWAEEYKSVDPHVAVAVSGGGSGVGISALLNGTVDLANSSRTIKKEERALALQRGIEPVEHEVGYDALAVFVHASNPLESLSLEQLRGIYGEGGALERWSQLGIEVPGCPSDRIVVINRQNNSGTYAYFKEAVLQEDEFRLGTLDMHGSKDVSDLVAGTPCAIGYSGLAYTTDQVRVPCIQSDTHGCVPPTVETAVDKTYPIARPLFMYSDGPPSGVLKTYLDWLLSDTGQCIIKAKGYAAVRQVTCG